MSDKRMIYPWSVLGYGGPVSESEVRRAYAVRLKALDREANPQGFEQLRAAYELARRLAVAAAKVAPPEPAPETPLHSAPETPPVETAGPQRSVTGADGRGDSPDRAPHQSTGQGRSAPSEDAAPDAHRDDHPKASPDAPSDTQLGAQSDAPPDALPDAQSDAQSDPLSGIAPKAAPKAAPDATPSGGSATAPDAPPANPPARPSIPNVPPHGPHEGQHQSQSQGQSKGQTLNDVIRDMRGLVADENWSEPAWVRLLTRPVLDDLRNAETFESALIDALMAHHFPVTPPDGGVVRRPQRPPADFVRLLDSRYGWLSDGLKFERKFPAAAHLRFGFVSQIRFAEAKAPRGSGVSDVKRGLSARLSQMVQNPTVLAITILGLSILVANNAGTPRPLYVALVGIAGLYALLRLRTNRFFTRESLEKLRPASLARPLVRLLTGRNIVRATVVPLAWLAIVGLFVAVIIPPEAPRRIRTEQMAAAMAGRTLDMAAIGAGNRIRTSLSSEKKFAVQQFGSGRIDATRLLDRLWLPYPMLWLAQDSRRADFDAPSGYDVDRFRPATLTPVKTEVAMFCQRDGACKAGFESAMFLSAITTEADSGGVQTTQLENPVLWLTAAQGAGALSDPVVQPDHLLANISFGADLPEGLRLPDSVARRLLLRTAVNLPVMALAGAVQRDISGPTLRVSATRHARDAPWLSPECASTVRLTGTFDKFIAANPRAEELAQALCSLPPEAIDLRIKSCIPDPVLGLDLCPVQTTLYNGPLGVSRDNSLRSLHPGVSDSAASRFDSTLDGPGVRLFLALMMRWAGQEAERDGVLPGGSPGQNQDAGQNPGQNPGQNAGQEARQNPDQDLVRDSGRVLGRAMTDQVIRDYLTLFWKAPWPEDITAYLRANPGIGALPVAPTQNQLDIAAFRQPQIAPFYRVEDAAATVILQDMFDFLKALGLIQPDQVQ